MGFFDDDDEFYLNVVYTIKHWRPKRYKSEKQYQKDLFALLKSKKWIRYKITKDSGKAKADIGIGKKVGIEIKYNLTDKSKIDRLAGQMRPYLKEYSGAIMLICGKLDRKHKAYFKKSLRLLREMADDRDQPFRSIYKNISQ